MWSSDQQETQDYQIDTLDNNHVSKPQNTIFLL